MVWDKGFIIVPRLYLGRRLRDTGATLGHRKDIQAIWYASRRIQSIVLTFDGTYWQKEGETPEAPRRVASCCRSTPSSLYPYGAKSKLPDLLFRPPRLLPSLASTSKDGNCLLRLFFPTNDVCPATASIWVRTGLPLLSCPIRGRPCSIYSTNRKINPLLQGSILPCSNQPPPYNTAGATKYWLPFPLAAQNRPLTAFVSCAQASVAFCPRLHVRRWSCHRPPCPSNSSETRSSRAKPLPALPSPPPPPTPNSSCLEGTALFPEQLASTL